MTAYFEFQQQAPDGRIHGFIFKLDDTARIAQARRIIADGLSMHVQGMIVGNPVAYNPAWTFHLEPTSIGFFELAAEVCDANVTYVAEHLSEVGTDFLPGNHWCPWSSVVTREVTQLVDTGTERLST